jgi:hypothetical protein
MDLRLKPKDSPHCGRRLAGVSPRVRWVEGGRIPRRTARDRTGLGEEVHMKKLMLFGSLLLVVGVIGMLVARRRGADPQAAWNGLADSAKRGTSQVTSAVKEAVETAKEKAG